MGKKMNFKNEQYRNLKITILRSCHEKIEPLILESLNPLPKKRLPENQEKRTFRNSKKISRLPLIQWKAWCKRYNKISPKNK